MIEEHKYGIIDGERHDMSLFGAFSSEERIVFQIRASGTAGISSVVFVIHSDGMESCDGEHYMTRSLTYVGCEGECEVFEFELDLSVLASLSDKGLFYYRYDFDFSGEVISYGGEAPIMLTHEEGSWDRQLLLYDASFKTPRFMRGGTMYHIFVDRFRRGGNYALKDGAKYNPDPENGVPEFPPYRGAPIKNNEFFGGDLDGVTEKLPYLESLGVSVIYLSPIFSSPSNHKYDTENYMEVDSMFGGDAALVRLTEEAARFGIRVILDGVFNHTGADSVYFDRYSRFGGGAYSDPDSIYRDWYFFKNYPDEYECWWGIPILPKVDSGGDSFMNFVIGDGGVAEKYMGMGIAGFRLDVADELSERFIKALRARLRSEDSDSLILGEVWEDASCKVAYSKRRHYFDGTELDSVMNYPLREGVIAFIKDGDHETLRYAMETVYRHYPKCVSDVLMNFLSTHDTERIITVLAGEDAWGKAPAELAEMKLSASERERGIRLVKCAYAIVASCYGIPSVFYGDEAGLEGYHDPFCRRPFPWGREDSSLIDFFSRVGMIRKREPLFADGLFRVIDSSEDVFITERFDSASSIVTVVTRGSEYVFDSSGWECVLDSGDSRLSVLNGGSGFSVIPPFTARMFKRLELF